MRAKENLALSRAENQSRPAGLALTTLMRKLATHKRQQSEKRLKVRQGMASARLGFLRQGWQPALDSEPTYRDFRPILIAAGLPQIWLYDLRHSHATLLLIADEHPKAVSERLGHSTIKLTRTPTFTCLHRCCRRPPTNSRPCLRQDWDLTSFASIMTSGTLR